MEMPKSCGDCYCLYDDLCWCNVLGLVVYEYDKERHPDCPLVAVPDHGDLIDRDMVLEKAWDVETFVDAVRFAPTIIESEGDDEMC